MKRVLTVAAKIAFVLGAAWMHAALVGCLGFISTLFGPGPLEFTGRVVVFVLVLPLSAVAAVLPVTWSEHATPGLFYVNCLFWSYLYLRILLRCFRADQAPVDSKVTAANT